MEAAAESVSIPPNPPPKPPSQTTPVSASASDSVPSTKPPALLSSAPPSSTAVMSSEDASSPSLAPSTSEPPAKPSADPSAAIESRLDRALDQVDDTLDRALGHAATGFFSFAAQLKSSLPPEAGAHLAGLRDGAKPRLEQLAAGVKDVVGTVQRNAVAVEEALLDATNGTSGAEKHSDGADAGTRGGTDGERSVHGLDPTDFDPAVNAAAFAQLDTVGFLVATGGEVGDGGLAADGNGDGKETAGVSGSVGVDGAAVGGSGTAGRDLNVNQELARAAETLQKSVAPMGESVKATMGGFFGSLSQWAAGDGEDVDETNGDGDAEVEMRDTPLPRFQALVRDVEVNPDTYCEPPADLDAFEEWAADFDLDKLENECISLLDRHASIAELYERVVPKIIEENTFWMRYFFARHVLDRREEERIKLLQRAVGGAAVGETDDAGWDDDWDVDEDDASGDVKGGGDLAPQGGGEGDVGKGSAEATREGKAESGVPQKVRDASVGSARDKADGRPDDETGARPGESAKDVTSDGTNTSSASANHPDSTSAASATGASGEVGKESSSPEQQAGNEDDGDLSDDWE